MIKVGDKVIVRNPASREIYHLPLRAKVVEVKEDAVLIRKEYLLEFENGMRQWFNQYDLKKE